ncbi:MAG TPA: DMT family transporter [Candidatus Bathyarchaeia archaeon]|nr:DMT family transporter [Candidatus Bathyarchaeia archaeon]
MSWYLLSLSALLFFGLQKFLFKVAAEKKSSTRITNFYFMITVAVLSFIFFFLFSRKFMNLKQLILFALLNGVIFLSLNIFRLESLKYIPGVVAFPMFELSYIPVIIFSRFYFRESLNFKQILGVFFGILVALLVSRKETAEQKRYREYYKGTPLLLGAIVSAAILSLISKIIAISSFNTLLFMGISYLFNTVLLFAFHHSAQVLLRNTKDVTPNQAREAITIGILMGITNFIAFFSYLKALEKGSLLVVSVLSGLSSLVAIVLSVMIYKEKLNWRRIVAIGLTIVTMVLLKI